VDLLLFTNKEGLVIDGSLGCNDHETVEFKILRALRKGSGRVQSLNLRRVSLDWKLVVRSHGRQL